VLVLALFYIFVTALIMFNAEEEINPATGELLFDNFFDAFYWAACTLTTVGYGDIYPVTVLGQILGIIITFLGVGLVAIPTGIISAGFIEEYQNAKKLADIEQEQDVRFIEASIDEGDEWAGKTVSGIAMPSGSIIALVLRGKDTLIPYGDLKIELGDKLIICAESASQGMLEDVKEIILRRHHEWNGQKIRDLDISRQTFIVMVDRDGSMLKPDPDLVLKENDKVLVFSKENLNRYMKEPLF
jgi:voltage-gated potassium channel